MSRRMSARPARFTAAGLALGVLMQAGLAQASGGLGPLTSIRGLTTFSNEAVAQLTTNPPSPDVTNGDRSQDARYDQMSWFKRLAVTNGDALKSIGRSLKSFAQHPLSKLGPILKNGASSSIQPFTNPRDTLGTIKDYYHKKGFVDGTATAAYTISNVVSVVAIGAGLLAVAGMMAHIPGAPALGGIALGTLGISSILGLVASSTQFVSDEAQSAAPESGVKLPGWIPFIGGKPLFKPTSHQQQVDLVKFDLLNTGGSGLMVGFAKLGGAAAYAGLAATEVGIVAGAAPADSATAAPAAPRTDLTGLRSEVGRTYSAVRLAATQGDAARFQSAQAAYVRANQALHAATGGH